MLSKILQLFGLVIVAILATYFAPNFVATAFYVATLFIFFRSKDNPFWFAFFFVISDGFIGFFNTFDAVISAIPGLPPIEVGHYFIILSVVKAAQKQTDSRPFYHTFMIVMLIYVLFMIIQSYVIGVSMEMNVQFRILKLILPLFAFYAVPRLFDEIRHYREVFILLIPFGFAAFFAQIFTVATGLAPADFFGVQVLAGSKFKEVVYRGFFSTTTVLITLMGAVLFTAVNSKRLAKPLLYAVMIASFLSAFLSATRGWVLGFTLIIMVHMILVLKMSPGRIMAIAGIAMLVIFSSMAIPTVEKQFSNAFARILTLESLAQGDVTAGGTLLRLNERAPRVMKKWKESPLTGVGYSNDFFEYGDEHVGNHNILMQSGVIGALLMGMFFFYFNGTLLQRSAYLSHKAPLKFALLIFPIFFVGWFLIHSTSGQQFSYHSVPVKMMCTAYFFSLGALVYKKSFEDDSSTEDW